MNGFGAERSPGFIWALQVNTHYYACKVFTSPPAFTLGDCTWIYLLSYLGLESPNMVSLKPKENSWQWRSQNITDSIAIDRRKQCFAPIATLQLGAHIWRWVQAYHHSLTTISYSVEVHFKNGVEPMYAMYFSSFRLPVFVFMVRRQDQILQSLSHSPTLSFHRRLLPCPVRVFLCHLPPYLSLSPSNDLIFLSYLSTGFITRLGIVDLKAEYQNS